MQADGGTSVPKATQWFELSPFMRSEYSDTLSVSEIDGNNLLRGDSSRQWPSQALKADSHEDLSAGLSSPPSEVMRVCWIRAMGLFFAVDSRAHPLP